MKRWSALPVLGLLAVATALLAGCGGTAARASSAAPVRTSQVDLPPSYLFSPAAIQVAPGTTVTWTNHDNFSHSVQVQGQSDVHVMNPGQSAQITFDKPGTYAYVCTFHTQNMKGTVIVAAS
jgi:plastocyanin